MVERTEIENYVRNMVALDSMFKPLKSLSCKAERREDKIAGEIFSLYKSKEDLGERVFVLVEECQEEKARTLRQGIDAFKKEYPSHGDVLEGMIKQKRIKKNKSLVYGLNEGYSLGSEDYIRVMMDLGFDREEACAVYPHIKDASERIGKSSPQEKRKILL